ncbi:transposase, partial [Micromonospora rubida]
MHLACEQGRRALALVITAGQCGDGPQFPVVLEAVRARTGRGWPHARPDRVLADKAYSSKANRDLLRRRGIRTTIPIKTDQAAHRRKRGRIRFCYRPRSNGYRRPALEPDADHVHHLPSRRSGRAFGRRS